jgi:predicted O-methyltransferase YrrM
VKEFARRWGRFTGQSLRASLVWPWTRAGRERFRKLHGRLDEGGGYSVPERDLGDVLPEVRAYEFVLPRALDGHLRAISVTEVCVLGALLRWLPARRVFEFGTYRGYSTLRLAELAPDAEITTLDRAAEVDFAENGERRRVRIGELFSGTPAAARITQIFCDSMAFDPEPFAGRIDVVFIDGNHTYPYVRRDTESAFRMLAPRGAIVWDDYTCCRGVERRVDELRQMDLFRPRGTSMVVYLRR